MPECLWLTRSHIFCVKHSQREEEVAIVNSIMAEDHAVLLKSVKKSMLKRLFSESILK